MSKDAKSERQSQGGSSRNPRGRRRPEAIGDILPRALPGPAAPVPIGDGTTASVQRRPGLRGRLLLAVCCHELLGWRDMIGLAVIYALPAGGAQAGLRGGVSRLAVVLGEARYRWGRRVKRWRRLGLVQCKNIGTGRAGRIIHGRTVPRRFIRRAKGRLVAAGLWPERRRSGRRADGLARLGYHDLPAGLVTERRLSLAARAVWAMLCFYGTGGADRLAYPSERTLCRRLRMRPVLLRRCLAELRAAGVIVEVGRMRRGIRAWAVRDSIGGAWVGAGAASAGERKGSGAAGKSAPGAGPAGSPEASGQMAQPEAVNGTTGSSKWHNRKRSISTSIYRPLFSPNSPADLSSSGVLRSASESGPARLPAGTSTGGQQSGRNDRYISAGGALYLDQEKHRQVAALRAQERVRAGGPAAGIGAGADAAGVAALRTAARFCTGPDQAAVALAALGVRSQEALRLARECGAEKVRATILLLVERLASGQAVRDFPAWLRRALERDYAGEQRADEPAGTIQAWAKEGVALRIGGTGYRLMIPPADVDNWQEAAAIFQAAADDPAQRAALERVAAAAGPGTSAETMALYLALGEAGIEGDIEAAGA